MHPAVIHFVHVGGISDAVDTSELVFSILEWTENLLDWKAIFGDVPVLVEQIPYCTMRDYLHYMDLKAFMIDTSILWEDIWISALKLLSNQQLKEGISRTSALFLSCDAEIRLCGVFSSSTSAPGHRLDVVVPSSAVLCGVSETPQISPSFVIHQKQPLHRCRSMLLDCCSHNFSSSNFERCLNLS